MKKFRASIAAFSVVASMASTSFAYDMRIRPYAGVEYQYSMAELGMSRNAGFWDGGIGFQPLTFDFGDSNSHALAPYAGVRIGRHFGVEFGFSKTTSESESSVRSFNLESKDYVATLTNKHDIMGYTVDVNGYYPVARNMELIGQIGTGYYEHDYHLTGSVVEDITGDSAQLTGIGNGVSDRSEVYAFRIGAGLQYNIRREFSVRTLARYISFDSSSIDDIFQLSIGGNYNF